MIGLVLVVDGFGLHIPKGYVYAAIGFSLLIEILNQLAARGRRKGGRGRDHAPAGRRRGAAAARRRAAADATPMPGRQGVRLRRARRWWAGC